jgi:hypothetical protein
MKSDRENDVRLDLTRRQWLLRLDQGAVLTGFSRSRGRALAKSS